MAFEGLEKGFAMENEASININVNMDLFEGVTAQMFQVTTMDTEARLDCIYVDQMALAAGSETVQGKVVARINMSTKRLRELYDLLDTHFKNVKED